VKPISRNGSTCDAVVGSLLEKKKKIMTIILSENKQTNIHRHVVQDLCRVEEDVESEQYSIRLYVLSDKTKEKRSFSTTYCQVFRVRYYP